MSTAAVHKRIKLATFRKLTDLPAMGDALATLLKSQGYTGLVIAAAHKDGGTFSYTHGAPKGLTGATRSAIKGMKPESSNV